MNTIYNTSKTAVAAVQSDTVIATEKLSEICARIKLAVVEIFQSIINYVFAKKDPQIAFQATAAVKNVIQNNKDEKVKAKRAARKAERAMRKAKGAARAQARAVASAKAKARAEAYADARAAAFANMDRAANEMRDLFFRA